MYIACLCPNLVSVHFYAIPIYTSNFLNFLFTCIHSTTVLCDSTTVLCDMYMYCIERRVNISITRITRANNIAFVMLLLAMISLHMRPSG